MRAEPQYLSIVPEPKRPKIEMKEPPTIRETPKTFPAGHCLLFYLFEMEKKGSGWSCKSARVNLGKPLPVFDDERLSSLSEDNKFTTLRSIKEQFGIEKYLKENPLVFSCVVEGHLTAPTTIFQLVIDLKEESSKNQFIEYYKNRKTTSCSFYPEWQWVNEIPKEKYNEWKAV